MRVISGNKRGSKLKAPKGMDVRPTEDRIKESLFNILRPIKPNAIVLDLFAGSGSIGIEFLSRDAEQAYFVDIASASIATIKDNLNHTNLIDKSIIVNRDAVRALSQFSQLNIKFDYIYIDPPFKEHELLNKILQILSSSNLISKTGVVIIEHEKSFKLEKEINDLIMYDNREYGSKTLSFYSQNRGE